MEQVSANTIMDWMAQQVAEKNPIDPHLWLEAALKLNVLTQAEQELRFDMEQTVALHRKVLLDDGKTVAYAKTMIEATDDYKKMRIQKAKIDRILQFIMLSKQHSRTASDLMRSQM